MDNKSDQVKPDSKVFFSTGGLFPHKHRLEIILSDLSGATGNITLYTSEEYSLIFKHKHPVTITSDQLMQLKRGEEITVHDDNTKRHSFKIKI